MQIFIDSADIDEIIRVADLGILDGVTTNPSHLATQQIGKEKGMSFKSLIKEICNVVAGDVSVEVVATDYETIMKEAKIIAKINKNVVVKIPIIPQGLKAVADLKKMGIRCNVTLAFSANQALMAAKAGAYIISPFAGRLDDIGHSGTEVVQEIRQIYDNYDFKTKILYASVRHPLHVKEAALMGADIITASGKIIEQLYHHPLTDLGLKKFLDDWAKLKIEIK